MRLAILLLFLCGTLRAATYYVTQSGAGAHNGTSLGNARSVSEQNAASLAGDDVLSINGTITSQLVVTNSGTSGHPITYLFASGAKFSSPAWSNTGAIYLANKSYVVIDGAASGTIGGLNGNAGLANGVIENTANGTGLANSITSCGVYAQEAKSVTVKNLLISNIYVRTGTTDKTDGGAGINFLDTNGNGINNITVTNCVIHDAHTGINSDFGPAGDHDYDFNTNTIYSINWGIACGGRGSTSNLTNISAHGNLVYNWAIWNETVDNSFHHNGFFAFADTATERITNALVYGNYFGPGYGNGYQTSGIYINGYLSGVSCYNNIFACAAGEYVANGLITLSSNYATTLNVFSNTFVASGSGTSIQIQGSDTGAAAIAYNVENNLGSGGGGGTFIALYKSTNTTLVSNYNLGYNFSASLGYSYSSTGSASFKTYAQWQGLGFDANSITTNPLLNGSYGLSAGSPAIGTGTDLSAYFTTDAAGYTRTVPWDIGAYKYLGVSGSSSGGLLILGGNASIK